MVSMRSEKPICTPTRLSEVSPTLPLKRFQCSPNWRIHNIMLNGRGSSDCPLVLSRKIVRLIEGYIILFWMGEDRLIALSRPFKEDRSPNWRIHNIILNGRRLSDCSLSLSGPFKEGSSPNWRIHNIMFNGRRLSWLPSLVLSRKIA